VRLDEIADGAEQIAIQSAHLQAIPPRRCNLGEDCAAKIPPIANANWAMTQFEILMLRLFAEQNDSHEGALHERTTVNQSGQKA
jgi:hypothetical protein